MDEETRVVVHPGVYNEALVLDRPVSLIGAGMDKLRERERERERGREGGREGGRSEDKGETILVYP